jgi:two-component system, LytTR family, response regulator
MSELRTLIADDEPAARRGLRRILEAEAGVVVVGEARHGREAVEQIIALAPDVVFLDIQMPELNGFEVIEALADTALPVIVFVTAYDEWAVRAFEVQALDYILKPYEDERVRTVIGRVRMHFDKASSDVVDKVRALLTQRSTERKYLTRLIVREAGTVQFIPLTDVDWIEAADYYVRIHTGKKTQLVRYSLNELERQLDPERYVRVHRSAIVNVSSVLEIRVAHQNHHEIVLRGSARVPLSRSRKDHLETILSRAE